MAEPTTYEPRPGDTVRYITEAMERAGRPSRVGIVTWVTPLLVKVRDDGEEIELLKSATQFAPTVSTATAAKAATVKCQTPGCTATFVQRTKAHLWCKECAKERDRAVKAAYMARINAERKAAKPTKEPEPAAPPPPAPAPAAPQAPTPAPAGIDVMVRLADVVALARERAETFEVLGGGMRGFLKELDAKFGRGEA